MKEHFKRFQVWFRQGTFDLEISRISLREGYFEWSTFQAVQAVEKALKAVIVYSGVTPPRIHKLQTLIGICNRVCPEFKSTKFEFRYLESFTFISRYPFLLPGKFETPHEIIKKSEAERALKQAEGLLEIIEAILSHEMEAQSEEIAQIEEKLSKEKIEERILQIKDVLIKEFDPEKIILFGRFAREEEVSGLSTMDILVVADTDLPFIDRIHKARLATRGGTPIIEAIVYTPEEFKIMTEEVDEGFLKNALAEGRTIYESPKR